MRKITIMALVSMKDNLNYHGGSLQIASLLREVKRLAQGQNLQFNDRNQKDQVIFLEVVHELMNQGIIMWGVGTDGSESGPPWMSVTSYGNEVLNAGDFIPNDYDGYLSYFKQEVPNCDPTILTYLAESLQTFFNRNYFASSVMLGVASEAAFNVLYNAMTNYLTGPRKTKLEKVQREVSVKKRFEEIMKELLLLKSQLPPEIRENIESTLKSIFDLIRYQRNDAGHPTGKPINKRVIHANLEVFVMYCKFLYAIVNWLNTNS